MLGGKHAKDVERGGAFPPEHEQKAVVTLVGCHVPPNARNIVSGCVSAAACLVISSDIYYTRHPHIGAICGTRFFGGSVNQQGVLQGKKGIQSPHKASPSTQHMCCCVCRQGAKAAD